MERTASVKLLLRRKSLLLPKRKRNAWCAGKKHSPFCALPPGFRQKKREEDKQKKAAAKAGPAKDKVQGDGK